MKVFRKYFDEQQEEEITMKEAIEKLEGGGYYYPDTVARLLMDGNKLQTNSAIYYTKD